MCKRLFATVVLLLGFSQSSVASPLEDALAAEKRGDYATAMQLLRPLAEAGDAKAQYNMGMYYFGGKRGVDQDYMESFRWFLRSASQGNGVGQHLVGLSYGGGYGVPIDPLHAHVWFSLAASTSVGSDRADAVKFRNLMENRLTRAEITRAQAIALRCQNSNYKDCD